jgi:iron complex outermembrane recepter protein
MNNLHISSKQYAHLTYLLLFIFVFLSPVMASAESEQRPQTDANVFGHVVDVNTGEHIPFINLIIEGTRIGTITDATGHYLLTNLPIGEQTIIVQGLGFKTMHVTFEAIERTTIEVDIEIERNVIRLDEIIITASPTQSGFRYQPDQAFSGEDLQRRSEASFGEMLNTEPGVSMRSLGSAPARPVIRGLDGDRILVLQNGERMGDISETSADHSISLDPLVASRVEVVRGPASLLYGSSALGGVINLMTTDIPDDADAGGSGVFSLQGSTVNNLGAGFGRYTYAGDKLAASARLSYREAGDINTPDGVLYGTSMASYDGAAGIGFNSDNRVGGLSLSFTGHTYEIPESIDIPEEAVEIRMQRQSLQGRLRYERQGFFDKTQIRFNASRMYQEEIELERIDGVWNEDLEIFYEKYALSTTLTTQHKPRGMFDRGAFGINLHGHNLIVGGDETYTPGERRLSLGIFTFQEIPLSNIFRLQAGLRLDMQHTAALQNALFPNIDSKRNAMNYSGSIGLNHRPLEYIEVGGQFARSHRNPSVEELYANGPHLGAGVYEVGDVALKDEIGHGGDYFIRYSSDKLQMEAAGFINYFRNFIIFQPTGLIDEDSGYPIFMYEGDEARLLGGEISMKYIPTDGLSLSGGIDYVNGKRIRNGNDFLPFMPPFRFNTNIEYDFGKAWIGGKILMAATQNRVAPDEDPTEGYTLVGLIAGYRLNAAGRHVIILRADNLLNTRYRDHLSRIEDRNVSMPGRNINLAYRWFF